MVLSPKGGALARMLLPFRLGLGGVLGSGKQYVSWITVDDLASVVLHAIATPSLEGPVNAVSPGLATNRDLAETLARILRRPAFLPVPAFALRSALGERAREILLASERVAPAKLLASGYRFRHAGLEEAFRHVLGRSAHR
jgi:uncharacterized protein (TIGR01777 family)